MLDKKHVAFPGRLVIVGFGSIGQGVLPLLLRHLEIAADRITIITAEPRGHDVAAEYGIRFIETALTRSNYRALLEPQLGKDDFLLNVSVDVSSVALIELCQELGALYLDTCIEPWPGGYTDPSLPPSARSNYALRESALALRRRYPRGPTAVLTHGANPGLVSHFVKQALIDLARNAGLKDTVPATRTEWAHLAETLGVKAIHIAERDTQVSTMPKQPGEFVNTWSIDGFVSEGSQPAELGWGTHERHFPLGRPPPRLWLGRSDIPAAAGSGDSRAQLDPTRGALSRVSDHPWRIDLDCRLSDRPRRRHGPPPADLSLCLSSLRRRGAEPA